MNTKSLPANPSLEFDKKQAKKLLAEAQSGNEAALQRFAHYHPRLSHRDPPGTPELALHDALLVIAREYGFASWPRWKEFVASRRLDVKERAAELVRSACSGDMRKATTLLDAEPTLASFDLFTACACGDSDAVDRFISRDPSLATRKGGPDDREPILYACFSRFLRSNRERAAGILKAVRILIAHCADPNAHFFVVHDDKPEMQSCIYAAAGIANDADLTRLLIGAGVKVDDLDGETLYHAAEFHDVTCLALVLETSPPAPGINYCLGRALDFDNEAAALLFLDHGADPNHRVPNGRTHMHKAAMHGRSVAVVSAMLDRGGDSTRPDPEGISPYRFAVRFGHEDLVELFEAHGADRASAMPQELALGQAMRGSSPAIPVKGAAAASVLSRAAQLGDVAAIVRLLDAGADIDGASPAPTQHDAAAGMKQDHMRPLHSACWCGQFEASKLLIERGASLTALNTFGSDALGTTIHGSFNCHSPEGGIGMMLPEEIRHGRYAEIVELLIGAGAKLPDHVWGGSEAVQEVMRRYGVPDR